MVTVGQDRHQRHLEPGAYRLIGNIGAQRVVDLAAPLAAAYAARSCHSPSPVRPVRVPRVFLSTRYPMFVTLALQRRTLSVYPTDDLFRSSVGPFRSSGLGRLG